MMKQFKIVIAMVLLVASIFVMVNMLFNPQPIQLVLETGQEITTKNSDYFAMSTVMILIVSSFLIGASITYLFYNSDSNPIFRKDREHRETKESKESKETIGSGYDIIIPLLRDDEKKAVHLIKEHNGEILQNELVLKLGLSKVKTTRILAALERKQVIEKHRHGLTNSVKLRYMK